KQFKALERIAKNEFRSEQWPGEPRFIRSVDLRFRGQGYELNLPFTANLKGEFRREHQRRYGYAYENRELEIVTLRVRAVLPSSMPKSVMPEPKKRTGVQTRTARVWFGKSAVDTKLYEPQLLIPLSTCSGPAIVTEYSATTVVPAGMRFYIDKAGNLVVNTTPSLRIDRSHISRSA